MVKNVDAVIRIEWSDGPDRKKKAFDTMEQFYAFLRDNPPVALHLGFFKKVKRGELITR